MQKEVFSTFSQLLNGFPLKPFFTLAHSGVNQPFIREQLVFFQPLKNLLLTLVKRRGVFEQGLQSICLKRRQKITQKARSRSMIRSQRFRSKSWSPAHLGYSTSGKKFPQRGGWLLSHPDRGLQYYQSFFLEQFKKLLAKLFPPPFLAGPFSFHLIDQ